MILACFTNKWFADQEISFAMAALKTGPFIACTFTGFVIPGVVEKRDSLGDAMALSAAVCSVSILLTVLLVIVDKKARDHDA